MSLRVKFNLVMFLALSVGVALSWVVSQKILQENAKEEVLLNASIMMEMARGIRGYTVEEVRPIIQRGGHEVFIPQTVPAYAATKNFDRLRSRFPDYTYKEAALNPTNPVHRATDWEVDIIDYFKNNPDIKEFSDVRDTATGQFLFLSRPMKITNPQCLACHSTPDNAPQAMLDLYGPSNGFGWELNSVVGAQVVSVPMSLPLHRADQAFQFFIVSLVGIFLFIWVLLNIMLHFVVIKPIKKIADKANTISKGQIDIEEFEVKGRDEIASMATSFNRMHRSLSSAVKLIKQQKKKSAGQ